MNIKEQIGYRITTERKAKKLTQTKLGELAGGLRQSRINNWEKGIRTPGLEEIKQVSKILEVSPAYLMCLINEKLEGFEGEEENTLIPLLNFEQIGSYKDWLVFFKNNRIENKIPFVTLNQEIEGAVGENTFAIKMNDESMEPELKMNDLLVVDTERAPKPGNFVLAQHGNEILVRRFKLLSAISTIPKFELLALNTHWPTIQTSERLQCEILGAVVNLSRKLL